MVPEQRILSERKIRKRKLRNGRSVLPRPAHLQNGENFRRDETRCACVWGGLQSWRWGSIISSGVSETKYVLTGEPQANAGFSFLTETSCEACGIIFRYGANKPRNSGSILCVCHIFRTEKSLAWEIRKSRNGGGILPRPAHLQNGESDRRDGTHYACAVKGTLCPRWSMVCG